jgi:hypothetical protein
VHKVLDAENVVLLERSLDDGVVRERDALLVDLAIPALVDKLAHSLQVRLAKGILGTETPRILSDVPVGDVRLNKTEHLLCCPRDLDEDAVVDLQQAEELQDLFGLRRDLVNTGERPERQWHNGGLRTLTTHPRMRTTK